MKNANRLLAGSLRASILLLERDTPNATRMVVQNLQEIIDSLTEGELVAYFAPVEETTTA